MVHHDNAGGSRKLSAVAMGHTMQVKEQHYEKVGEDFGRCMRATEISAKYVTLPSLGNTAI